MSFDFTSDTVIGYVDTKKGENSAQLSVLGYMKSDGSFFYSSKVIFPPIGKVFCPSFFALDSFPDSVKNYKTVIMFSCIKSKEDTTNTHKDYYSVDIYRPMLPLPRLVKVSWTESTIGLSEKVFKDCLSIGGSWQAYPYNTKTGILYEEVKYDEGKFAPVKGKEIQGFSIQDQKFKEFSVIDHSPVIYCLPDDIQPIFSGEPRLSIDFMTIHQLKGWIKDKFTEYAKLDQGMMQQIRALVNGLPENSDNLDQIRLNRAKSLISNLSLTNEELAFLISEDNSLIGKEIHKQIEFMKETYFADWEKGLQEKYAGIRADLDFKNTTLENEVNNIEKQITEMKKRKATLEIEIQNQKKL